MVRIIAAAAHTGGWVGGWLCRAGDLAGLFGAAAPGCWAAAEGAGVPLRRVLPEGTA